MNVLKWASDLVAGDVLVTEPLTVASVKHVHGDTQVVFTNGYNRTYWSTQGVTVRSN